MPSALQLLRRVMDAALDCHDESLFRAAVLTQLGRIAPSDSCIFVRSTSDRLPVHVNKGAFLKLIPRLAEHRERYAPGMVKGQLAGARDGLFLDNEVYSARERRELPFYREFMKPQGITSQLIAHVRFQGDQTGIIYLCRHGRGTSFQKRELDALRPLISCVALGQAALRSRLQPPDSNGGALLATLTVRERQVARHVCGGLRNRDIAELLGTSPNTVRNQLQRIYDRLCVSSRSELAALLLLPPTAS